MAISTTLMAQISQDIPPRSFVELQAKDHFLTIQVQAPDLLQIEQEDQQRAMAGMLEASARKMPVGVDLYNSGSWTELANGDRVWRLRLDAPGALATELFFSTYQLPVGATMHVYDPSKEQVLGAFTNQNEQFSGRFATDLIYGPSCIIEYYEPLAVEGQGVLEIESIGWSYKDAYPLSAKADDCEVDVACSEGNNWDDQKASVVRLRTVDGSFVGWCTGSVVNNTNEDCTPYVLTALHCGETSNANDFQDWKFYFNYQRPNCGTGTALANQVMTGSFHRADSNDGGGATGSDFLLVEIDTDIPDNYTPYYAGWDASGPGSSSGVSIHHPAGDEKKISTYTSNLLSSSWGASGSHWRVIWSGTANGHGVTEGGSSGSPIYNTAKRIVGTLTGGGSACNSVQPGGQNLPDYYGKMSYHWDDNWNPTDDLKDLLAPGSSTTILNGSWDPCGSSIGIEEYGADAVTLYPNPTTGIFQLSLNNGSRISSVEVFNAVGALMAQYSPEQTQVSLDLSQYQNGTYYLVVEGATYRFSTSLVLLK